MITIETTTPSVAPVRPPLAGDANVDACVIGGGYTGLSAALHLAERGYKTLLLESHRVGWGASGRNGGQLNTGLRKGPGELVAMFGAAEAKRLFGLAEEGTYETVHVTPLLEAMMSIYERYGRSVIAVKEVPCSSRIWRKRSSVRSSFSLRGALPGSMTT